VAIPLAKLGQIRKAVNHRRAGALEASVPNDYRGWTSDACQPLGPLTTLNCTA
jgi:hypothetical protein